MAAAKPTVGFHERYATDEEFKQQVDEGRKRAASNRDSASLKDSLSMIRGDYTKKKKLY